MATSNLGTAIGNSKELNFAASLYDRANARRDARDAAAAAKAAKELDDQDKRDEAKLNMINRWIQVDTSGIHHNWQPAVQKATANFFLKAADKPRGWVNSIEGNAEFSKLANELEGYKKSSVDLSKDLVYQQAHPDDYGFKKGFQEAAANPDTFFDWLKENGRPDGTYTTGQGIEKKFNEVEALKHLKIITTPNEFSDVNDLPNKSMAAKGYKQLVMGKDYNTPDFEKNLYNLYANDPTAQSYGEGDFETFKKKLVGDLTDKNGRIYLGDKPQMQAVTTNWAPSTAHKYSRVGGLGFGQAGNNGSWSVVHTDNLPDQFAVTDPATGKQTPINVKDAYVFDNVSNSSEGQEASFVTTGKAIELNSGQKVDGNTVKGRLAAVVKVEGQGGADNTGYAAIVYGASSKSDQWVKSTNTKTGKSEFKKVSVIDQPVYMVPYQPNSAKIQTMTISKDDDTGFVLGDSKTGKTETTVETSPDTKVKGQRKEKAPKNEFEQYKRAK